MYNMYQFPTLDGQDPYRGVGEVGDGKAARRPRCGRPDVPAMAGTAAFADEVMPSISETSFGPASPEAAYHMATSSGMVLRVAAGEGQ